MPATSNRPEARRRIFEITRRALDKVVPPDEQLPLRGSTFIEFEDQVEEAGRAIMTALLEERTALDAAAWQEKPGRCPYCTSERVYLETEVTVKEVLSPVGPLRVRLQHCRCRACNGSFSPSGERLAVGRRCTSDSTCVAASVPRSESPAL